MVDTLRSDHLNAYGYSKDTSPVISRLAREGIRFTRFRANSNETSQTVASLLTGRYPSGHGLLRLGGPLPEDAPLLTERGSFPAATNRSTAFGEAETETGGYHYLLRDGWKLLLSAGKSKRLFNLKTDPGEKRNLYGRQPQTGDMEKALKQRIQRARRAAPKGP